MNKGTKMKKTISLLLFANLLFASDLPIVSGENVSARVDKGTSNYHLILAASGDTITTKVSNLDDNADLYVGVGYRPKSSKNDCKSTNSGTQIEECSVTLDKDAKVYVRVYGRRTTDYGITVTKSQVNNAPLTREQLKAMIDNGEDVTNINTSQITDMSGLFSMEVDFNQDISKWDVSNVTNMSSMFSNAEAFNQDISNWNVSNVTNMGGMFWAAAKFNQDISNWDVSNVTMMSSMFAHAENFNKDIGRWDVSNVTNMHNMFWGKDVCLAFNQDISNWDVSNVTDMYSMFWQDCYNGYNFKNKNLTQWNVKNVTNHEAFFNSFVPHNNIEPNWIDKPACLTKNELRRKIKNHEDVTQVDTSCITDMSFLFSGQRDFNQDISNWDVSNVTNMKRMFWNANSFNQYIGNWDVSKVTDMHSMFENAGSFNQDISKWNVTNINNFRNMFFEANTMEEKNKPKKLFPGNVETLVNEHTSVSKRHSKYYEIPVSSGDTITTKLSNLNDNADLYVGVGYRPKSNKNDCKSTHSGTQIEECSVTVDSDTAVYVRIYGRRTTNYFVTINKQ